jgi:hypothetical protein
MPEPTVKVRMEEGDNCHGTAMVLVRFHAASCHFRHPPEGLSLRVFCCWWNTTHVRGAGAQAKWQLHGRKLD